MPTPTENLRIDWKQLGRDLRAERVRRGWTQTELAERVGVNLDTVSAIETGRGGRSSLRIIAAIAAMVGHPLADTLPRTKAETEAA